MKPCVRCGRMTRPQGVRPADAPGTIARAGHGLCTTCYARDYKKGLAEHRPTTPKQTITCARCGLVRGAGGNSAVLCRDCRDVLTKQERALWAA